MSKKDQQFDFGLIVNEGDEEICFFNSIQIDFRHDVKKHFLKQFVKEREASRPKEAGNEVTECYHGESSFKKGFMKQKLNLILC